MCIFIRKSWHWTTTSTMIIIIVSIISVYFFYSFWIVLGVHCACEGMIHEICYFFFHSDSSSNNTYAKWPLQCDMNHHNLWWNLMEAWTSTSPPVCAGCLCGSTINGIDNDIESSYFIYLLCMTECGVFFFSDQRPVHICRQLVFGKIIYNDIYIIIEFVDTFRKSGSNAIYFYW